MSRYPVTAEVLEAVAKLRKEGVPPLECGLYKAILSPTDAASLLEEIGFAAAYVTGSEKCPKDALGPGERFVCALVGVLVVARDLE